VLKIHIGKDLVSHRQTLYKNLFKNSIYFNIVWFILFCLYATWHKWAVYTVDFIQKEEKNKPGNQVINRHHQICGIKSPSDGVGMSLIITFILEGKITVGRNIRMYCKSNQKWKLGNGCSTKISKSDPQ